MPFASVKHPEEIGTSSWDGGGVMIEEVPPEKARLAGAFGDFHQAEVDHPVAGHTPAAGMNRPALRRAARHGQVRRPELARLGVDAGESPDALAADYGLSLQEVEEAVVYERTAQGRTPRLVGPFREMAPTA
jgi:hypothetical protein